MQTRIVGAFLVGLVALAACKPDAPAGDAGASDGMSLACFVSVANVTTVCSLYTKVAQSSVATLEADCKKTGVPRVQGSCPAKGVVGTCMLAPTAAVPVMEVEYAYDTMSASDLDVQCQTEGGSFTGSVATSDAGSECAMLAGCCDHYTSIESSLKQACTAAVAAGNESNCHTELVAAMTVVSCGATPDGGGGSGTGSGSGTGTTLAKLGADPNPAVGLAIDSENAYWYDNLVTGTGTSGAGNVLKVPIAGGAVTTLASLTDGCGGFAVSGANLYWGSNSASLVTMPTSGGTPTTLVANGLTPASDPKSITANATDVFWCASNFDIMKTPVAGGAAVTLFKGTGTASFSDIAVNATDVFWSRGIDVRSVPLSGGTGKTAGTSMAAEYVAADSSNVYWVDRTELTILRAPLVGGTTVTLATRTALPHGIAIDDKKVYWAEDPNLTGATSGTVLSVPIGGGTVSTITTKAVLPGDIAVDSTGIYYVEAGIGVSGVWKITPK